MNIEDIEVSLVKEDKGAKVFKLEYKYSTKKGIEYDEYVNMKHP